MPRKKKYCVEIYEPGSRSRVVRELQSDTPLPAISRGDLVSWDGPRKTETMKEKPLLRVVGTEHVIRTSARGNPVHRIRILTEVAEVVTEGTPKAEPQDAPKPEPPPKPEPEPAPKPEPEPAPESKTEDTSKAEPEDTPKDEDHPEEAPEKDESHDAAHPKFGETRKIKREQPPVLPPT